MNTSTSWTGIPRDDREQERLRLEHQLFSNISFNHDAEDSDHRLGLEPYDEDEDGEQGSEFSLEYPRNPHVRSRDYSMPAGLYRVDDDDEGETKSSMAHHASAVTFRTGLRGRIRDQSHDLSNIEYDPDRPLDALLRGTSNLSILKDSPRINKEQSSSHSRSEFTKRAHGLGKQIDDEKSRRYPTARDLHDEPRRTTLPAPAAAFSQQSKALAANLAHTRAFPAFSRVQLPDVTGITSAAATPLKGDASFKRFSSSGSKQGVQFRLPLSSSSRKDSQSTTKHPRVADENTDALEDLTKRLGVIERENATSRRRVNELEMELETCKEEVAQEKTKLIELARDGNVHERGTRPSKTITTLHQGNVSLRESERRYREAVDERKALEDLVTSLRAHLTRMSEKVSNHHDIINTLRTTREQDAHELRMKCLEIDRLRSDVDTLQDDVIRLRDVVEDGLRERKRDEPSVIVIERPQVDVTADEEEESTFDNSLIQRPAPVPRRAEQMEALSAVMEEDEPLSRSATTVRSAEPHPAAAAINGNRFVQDAELERVRAEMEERRSMRSMNASSSRSIERSVIGSPQLHLQQSINTKRGPRLAQVHNTPPRPLTPDSDNQRPSPRIASQRPKSTLVSVGDARGGRESPVPMPQIRGERLEQLFHAAPAHNERTCGVCHRRKRTSKRHSSDHHRRRPSAHHHHQEEEERLLDSEKEECRFVNGDERFIADIAQRRGIPPQTVLARVLRELEDDFTHYKAIYVELADEYKAMDAASDMSKRNLLANHLREVIDVLEQKGDQIASLYDLLRFEDKPLSSSSPKPSSSTRRRLD